MRRLGLISAFVIALFPPALLAQAVTDGPYKVLKTARVGGEGGTDYIQADPDGRRLYIPRGGVRADTTIGRAAIPARITVFNLDNLDPAGEILTAPNSQGNGAAVDPKSGHGFSSSRPEITMFDTKTLQLLKSIPKDSAFGPDGIYYDSFNERIYVFSHPTHDAMVIDGKDGTVLGRIPLPGTPEQGVSDGKGLLYVAMQDSGSVAVVDVKLMKTIASYPFGGNVGCNGLALDAKNRVLFAACSRVGPPPPPPQPGQPAQPPQPMMVILSANDGKILAKLPLAGGSDGAVFNPATNEAFSSHSNGTMTIVKENSPTDFFVEQNLGTMNGARTLTLDTKTGHVFVMSVERGPAPPPPPGGGRAQGPPAIPGSFTILMIGKP
jgi:DNA-binding beta-propeller fold protein YncE